MTKKQASITARLLVVKLLWDITSMQGDIPPQRDYVTIFEDLYSSEGLEIMKTVETSDIFDEIRKIGEELRGKHMRFNSDLEIIAYAKTF